MCVFAVCVCILYYFVKVRLSQSVTHQHHHHRNEPSSDMSWGHHAFEYLILFCSHRHTILKCVELTKRKWVFVMARAVVRIRGTCYVLHSDFWAFINWTSGITIEDICHSLSKDKQDVAQWSAKYIWSPCSYREVLESWHWNGLVNNLDCQRLRCHLNSIQSFSFLHLFRSFCLGIVGIESDSSRDYEMTSKWLKLVLNRPTRCGNCAAATTFIRSHVSGNRRSQTHVMLLRSNPNRRWWWSRRTESFISFSRSEAFTVSD